MARILKVKKSWYIDYNLDGKRIKKVIGGSKRIAELALSDIEAKIRPSRSSPRSPPDILRLTMASPPVLSKNIISSRWRNRILTLSS